MYPSGAGVGELQFCASNGVVRRAITRVKFYSHFVLRTLKSYKGDYSCWPLSTFILTQIMLVTPHHLYFVTETIYLWQSLTDS